MVSIEIDSHEDKLIKALESDNLKKECGHMFFDIKTLDVGDVIFKNGDKIVCLIERKTLDDYASSIIDGRSKNQSIRISQLRIDYPDIIIVYLIEGGNLPKDYKFHNGITRDALYSSIVNRVVRDHFTIYRTNDINDTAIVIAKMYDKIIENDQISANGTGSDTQRIEYLKTIKLSKKENMTPINCYVCQLAQIQGVSIDIADVISKHYSSMKKLIMSYEAHKDKGNMLSEIMIPIANDKFKRLGKVISNRIYEYLCGDDNVEEDEKITEKAPEKVGNKKILLKLKQGGSAPLNPQGVEFP